MNKNIISYNDKGQKHGYWEVYHPNGQLGYKCVYINGNENGFEELYLNNYGKLTKNYNL